MKKAPALFLSHGAPLAIITEDRYAAALRELGEKLQKPRAIVVMSAHGLTPDGSVEVCSAPNPSLIYDFGGFPRELYEYRYPCPGEPDLAKDILAKLYPLGFSVVLDEQAGIDHGVWVPAARMFPKADIPIVQITMPFPSDPESVLAIGKALAPLRDEGVVLVGSGGAVHNLRMINRRIPGAEEFKNWVKERVESMETSEILNFETKAPNARVCHPTTEHFYPMFFTLGAALANEKATTIFDEFQYESLSLYSFGFGL